MKKVSEFVARLKAWQVFLVLLVLMAASQAFVVSSFMPDSGASSTANFKMFDELLVRMSRSTFLMLSLLFAWLFSIGFAANRRIPEEHRAGTRLAIAAVVVALGYTLAIPSLWPSPSDMGNEDFSGASVAIIFPLHLLTTAGIFYVLRFAAKTLATAEAGGPVTYTAYTSTFLMLWFFPIGVWFVQPRVNRLVSKEP